MTLPQPCTHASLLACEGGRALLLVDPLFRVTCLPLLQSLMEKTALPSAVPLLPFTAEGSLLYSNLPDGRGICSLAGTEVPHPDRSFTASASTQARPASVALPPGRCW